MPRRSARHVGERELTCEAGIKGAKLFVLVLACELFSEKTARRGSATGSAQLYAHSATFVEPIDEGER